MAALALIDMRIHGLAMECTNIITKPEAKQIAAERRDELCRLRSLLVKPAATEPQVSLMDGKVLPFGPYGGY